MSAAARLYPLSRLLLLTGVVALAGCREAPALPVRIEVRHFVDDARELQLGQEQRTAAGLPLQIGRLSYYLGQFRLRREDRLWAESDRRGSPDGDYVLIDAQNPASQRFTALSARAGRYDTLELRLGIDGERNRGGARAGALDPGLGMFWTWNSGYIFLALEARSPASGAADQSLTYHLGGDDSLSRVLSLPLDPPLNLNAAAPAPIRLSVDLARVFDGLDLARIHTVMDASGATPVMDRVVSAIRVDGDAAVHDPAGAP